MPIEPPPSPASLQSRIEELELKAIYLEDVVDSLNGIVAQQQRQIDALLKEARHMREQVDASQPGVFRSLRDELPPHY